MKKIMMKTPFDIAHDELHEACSNLEKKIIEIQDLSPLDKQKHEEEVDRLLELMREKKRIFKTEEDKFYPKDILH